VDDPDLRTLRSLVRAISGRRLFTRIDRPMMARWYRDPQAQTDCKDRLADRAARVKHLRVTRETRLLTGREAQDLARLGRNLQDMQRRRKAWEEVYASVPPRDYPFVLGPEEALTQRVMDGCTSASRVFCHLAQEAGFDARPVMASNLDSLMQIWRTGMERSRGNVNGHKMALVEVKGRWYLVNPNYFAPTEAEAYEIFTELDGKALTPDTITGKVLRLPSMQVDDGRRSPRLVIVGVGKRGEVDLGEFSLEANLNLAVSGKPDSKICVHPALLELMPDK
jgi:hypothetical protein